MRKVLRTQAATITWTANSTTAQDIERVGLINEIHASVEVTQSAALLATFKQDGLSRVIQGLRIEGNGIYFNLPTQAANGGGMVLHYMNLYDGYGPGHRDGVITGAQQTFLPVNFVLHCGSRPWGYGPMGIRMANSWDATAFIPAFAETQLKATWITGANSVIDSSSTISSAVMRFTIARTLATPDEMVAEMARQAVQLPAVPGITGMVPAWAATPHANVASTTDFDAETVNVPVGAFLKRLFMLTHDATANTPILSTYSLSQIAIRIPKTSEDLVRSYLHHNLSLFPMKTQAKDGVATYGVVPQLGGEGSKAVYVTDFRAHSTPDNPAGKDYGSDLRFLAVGDIYVGLIIPNFNSGDQTLMLWERYQPYLGPLA